MTAPDPRPPSGTGAGTGTKQLTLLRRALRGYGIGILGGGAAVALAYVLSRGPVERAGSENFAGLGVFLMWIAGGFVMGVLLQIPLGRLVGLGWGYGCVVVAVVAAGVGVSFWSRQWGVLTIVTAVAPLVAAAVTTRHDGAQP